MALYRTYSPEFKRKGDSGDSEYEVAAHNCEYPTNVCLAAILLRPWAPGPATKIIRLFARENIK